MIIQNKRILVSICLLAITSSIQARKFTRPPVHVARSPSPANVKLNPGETLSLVCKAVGVPIPLISWHLNRRNVPEKCISTSVNGIGTLTCPDMQSGDSGAYSCKAINNKRTTFAAQDAIVYVNRTGRVCPNIYFNSEARSQSECIRCFCFGKSTQCQSADLFIFNMPTPLGEGSTRLVGVNQDYKGDVKLDRQQDITNQYYYQPLRNGATVTKLADFGSSWAKGTKAHSYLTLPETYNGNQLTSYGGRIKYRVSAHNPSRFRISDSVPDIIILGKYQTLLHKNRNGLIRKPYEYINARLTPGNWQKPSPRGLVQASREDIMMALDDIELILLPAGSNNAGLNITEFTMESAQMSNVGLGAASLVEECSCPIGYKGRSCEKCAEGFEKQNSGLWNGTCVPKAPCPPLTYGDPSSGGDCKPCPCPLTNRGNQFASSCFVGPRGNVICDCQPGYEGPDCSYCASNYIGNPLIVGDSCRHKPQNNCYPLGTSRVRLPDECVCKENVQGRYCDQCKNGSFYLSDEFRDGCALCFCSGVSTQCMTSNLRRKTTTVRFDEPQIVDQVKLYKSAPIESAGAVVYNASIETDFEPEIRVRSSFERSQLSILYWSLPVSFAGDKITSYGGFLSYELRHVPTYGGLRNTAPDVQLISVINNSLTLHYFGNFAPASDGYLNARVQFLEKGWQRPDGKEVLREHFLVALSDVKTILVKATYSQNTDVASIVSASIDTAEPNGDGPLAQHVEMCQCPVGHMGTSCEDCKPGYTRNSTSLYLENCVLCACNGHSNMCHPETGECYDCADNTAGPDCETCKAGFELDQNNNCVPSSTPKLFTCNCDPRGEAQPCDASGRCQCKQNVEGEQCDRCRPGTFGLDSKNPRGCFSCYCSGVTNDCHEASHYSRIPLAAPIFGEDYGGYTLMETNANQVINDQFILASKESELMYSFSSPHYEELYWSLPVYPGNRVLSYGGTLSLTQKFQTVGVHKQSTPGRDIVLVGESLTIYWTNPTPIRSEEALSYQVPLREANWYKLNSATAATREDFMSVLKNLKRVLVHATLSNNIVSTSIADVSMDTAVESYDPTAPAAKGVEVCMCPEGHIGTSCENCAGGFYKDRAGYCRQCNCNGHDCRLGSHDEIVCTCRPPKTGPVCATVRREAPRIDIYPQGENSVKLGSQYELRCNVNGGIPPPIVTWARNGGRPLSQRVQILQNNILRYYSTIRFQNVDVNDDGEYTCTATNEAGSISASATIKVPSPPVITITPDSYVNVNKGDRVNVECRADGYPEPEVSILSSDLRLLVAPSPRIAVLSIQSASEDEHYICTATSAAGTIKEPFFVQVDTVNDTESTYTVRVGDTVETPCNHNLEEPVSIEWRREYSQLPSGARQNEHILRLESVSEADAGTYVCRVSNNRATLEARATLRIIGVVPKFNGDSWLALPTLKDASMQFDIEISFKPSDPNGIILYNSQNQNGTGDYLILELVNGVPEFTLKFGITSSIIVTGNALQLNLWHTIRLSRNGYKVIMDVDNTVPIVMKAPAQYEVLELYANLYVGGAPPQRPPVLEDSPGLVGCVSVLILGKEEKNIIADSINIYHVSDCDPCSPNLCLNNGVCQEARNERGYTCLCPAGYAGLNCNRLGEACRPGLCGLGKCTDTVDGHKCACPVTYTGRNCEIRQNISYPAFEGSGYLAIKPPMTSRYLLMTMKIRPKAPVTDGIIMYCAHSARGYGGFTSLAVHDSRLEFRYDHGDGNDPVVLISNKTLVPSDWTDVHIACVGPFVSLNINMTHSHVAKLTSAKDLNFQTSMFVGGVDDDSIVLNNNTGVTSGFSGCIKDVTLHGEKLDLTKASIQAVNVQECVNYDRRDIPETESICSQCRNGGYCTSPDMMSCTCPRGFIGIYCENRILNQRPSGDPCSAAPCKNLGTCKIDYSQRMNYTCDCPLGFAGFNCQKPSNLLHSVGFNGNGYLELPASYLPYDTLDKKPELIALAFNTYNDGVLLYQNDLYVSEFIMLRVEKGVVVMEWDLGSHRNIISVDEVLVNDDERHEVIAKIYNDGNVELTVGSKTKTGVNKGITTTMNANSNIYIGGIPEYLYTKYKVPGLVGCIQQVGFNRERSLNLGRVAVSGRNTQRCKKKRSA